MEVKQQRYLRRELALDPVQRNVAVRLFTRLITEELLLQQHQDTPAKHGIRSSHIPIVILPQTTPMPVLKVTTVGTLTTGTKELGATRLILMFAGPSVMFLNALFLRTITVGTRNTHSCPGIFLHGILL